MDKEAIRGLVQFIELRTKMDALWDEFGEVWLEAYAPGELKKRKEPWNCSCRVGCPLAYYYCASCDGDLCT